MNTPCKIKRLSIYAITLMLFCSIQNQSFAGCIYSQPLEVIEEDMGNLLKWSTAEESMTNFFSIQKSNDGIIFSSIGEVKAVGDSDDELSYRFLDPSLGEQKVFYRILLEDLDGQSSFTHIVMMNKVQKNNYLISMMGNTTTERYFNVVIESQLESQMSYRLVNYNKEVVKRGVSKITQGSNLISIDFDEVIDGKYQIVFKMKNEEESVMILKEEEDQMADKSLVPTNKN